MPKYGHLPRVVVASKAVLALHRHDLLYSTRSRCEHLLLRREDLLMALCRALGRCGAVRTRCGPHSVAEPRPRSNYRQGIPFPRRSGSWHSLREHRSPEPHYMHTQSWAFCLR